MGLWMGTSSTGMTGQSREIERGLEERGRGEEIWKGVTEKLFLLVGDVQKYREGYGERV